MTQHLLPKKEDATNSVGGIITISCFCSPCLLPKYKFLHLLFTIKFQIGIPYTVEAPDRAGQGTGQNPP